MFCRNEDKLPCIRIFIEDNHAVGIVRVLEHEVFQSVGGIAFGSDSDRTLFYNLGAMRMDKIVAGAPMVTAP